MFGYCIYDTDMIAQCARHADSLFVVIFKRDSFLLCSIFQISHVSYHLSILKIHINKKGKLKKQNQLARAF